MKKKYISPDILLTKLSVCKMICVSGGVDGGSMNNENEPGTDGEDLSRRNNIWDDDYDY